MKIFFLPQDFDATGSYRVLWPMEELRRHGHQPLMPPFKCKVQRKSHSQMDPTWADSRRTAGFMDIEMDIKPAVDADVYLLQLPMQQVHVQLARLWSAKGKPVIAEMDDDVFNLPKHHPAYDGTHPALNPQRNRGFLSRVLKYVSAITVSTPELAQVYSEFHPNVHILPNYLWWPWWKDVRQRNLPDNPRVDGRVRIGWMGRSFWRPKDVEMMKDIVLPVLDKHPDVDFVAAGDPGVHDQLDIPEDRRVSLPPVDFRRRESMNESYLPEITASMDIGLVPLEKAQFNEGKSYLKGMEYAACGIPCVATPTREYKSWCAHGNGFLAESPREWHEAIEHLLDDGTRVTAGRAARKKAERHTLQKHWQKWADCYLGETMKARKNARELPGLGSAESLLAQPRAA